MGPASAHPDRLPRKEMAFEKIHSVYHRVAVVATGAGPIPGVLWPVPAEEGVDR